MAVEIQALGRCEAEQAAPPLTRPHVVAREIANPEAKVGGFDGQAHARLALAQPRLAYLQFVDELRRAQHVTAQLVPHHRHQAEVAVAHDNRRLDVSPEHQ